MNFCKNCLKNDAKLDVKGKLSGCRDTELNRIWSLDLE